MKEISGPCDNIIGGWSRFSIFPLLLIFISALGFVWSEPLAVERTMNLMEQWVPAGSEFAYVLVDDRAPSKSHGT